MANIKKYIGSKAFYRSVLAVAVPIMIQNGITNFVSLLDNIMVGLHYYIRSSMLLHLRLQLHLERVLEHLRELLVVRLYSQLMMLRHGLKEERKSYLYVLRHLQRTSQE